MLFMQFLIILTIAGELCYFGQVQARLAHNMCYVINDVIRLKGIPHFYSTKYVNQINNKTGFYRSQKAAIS